MTYNKTTGRKNTKDMDYNKKTAARGTRKPVVAL